jgi:nitrite reductase (NADH) small subunit
MTDLHDDTHLALADHPTWQRVCRLNDLEPGWGEAALLARQQVALFRLGSEEVYAVQQADPATGSHVIARGITGSSTVGTATRPTVAAPLHKQVYDLGTGACLNDPSWQLRTYPTRVIDGWLEVAA